MATPGWIPQLRWDRLWRLSKSSVDSPGDRQFAARDLLHSWLKPAPGWGNPQEWKIYAAAGFTGTKEALVENLIGYTMTKQVQLNIASGAFEKIHVPAEDTGKAIDPAVLSLLEG